jgi:hypothetical protein
MPLGRATELREDAAGLWGAFRVSKTTAGDEALELIRDGALDGLSIGFKPIRDGPVVDGLVERLEVALYEVSAVAFPAYAGALVEAVREESTRHLGELGVGTTWTPGTSPADLADRLAALTPKIHTRDARQRLAALTKGTFR